MRRARQRGFTLIELMVTVSVIGVLALIGVPHFRAYVLDARLNDAQPMLTQIAAAMRTRMLERGQYCCQADPAVEANIVAELRTPLDEVGDFCFMIICRDPALCPTVSAADFITPAEAADATPEFEVWAVLRETAAGNIAAPGDACEPDAAKRPPTGWAKPSTATEPGREGQVVALRYPPPANGLDATAGTGGHLYDWNAGLSKTHAMQP